MAVEGIEGNNGIAFRGAYKVTLPKVNTIKDKNERDAATEAVINTVVMGNNMSIEQPKVFPGGDLVKTYFKISDRNDENFEKGFKSIVDNCNKAFNVDISKKVYLEKISDDVYNNAHTILPDNRVGGMTPDGKLWDGEKI